MPDLVELLSNHSLEIVRQLDGIIHGHDLNYMDGKNFQGIQKDTRAIFPYNL